MLPFPVVTGAAVVLLTVPNALEAIVVIPVAFGVDGT